MDRKLKYKVKQLYWPSLWTLNFFTNLLPNFLRMGEGIKDMTEPLHGVSSVYDRTRYDSNKRHKLDRSSYPDNLWLRSRGPVTLVSIVTDPRGSGPTGTDPTRVRGKDESSRNGRSVRKVVFEGPGAVDRILTCVVFSGNETWCSTSWMEKKHFWPSCK